MERLKLSKDEPPSGYSYIGHFKTFMEANNWYLQAKKAKKDYPFHCQAKQYDDGKQFILWWKKPKSSKMTGKGWG
jgi:hypothetical protein